MTAVFKIMGVEDWEQARTQHAFPAAAIDRRDGFIHLSTEDQVLETARLHFTGRDDLLAVEFDDEDFGDALKWEASRRGARFPHLFAELPVAKARGARRLLRRADGGFGFGEIVP